MSGRMKCFRLGSLAIALALSATSVAQIPVELGQQDRVTISAKVSPAKAHAGEFVTLEVTVEIEPGWHLYGSGETVSVPTTFKVTELGGLEVAGAAEVPIGEEHELAGIDETSFWIREEFVVTQRLLVPAGTKPGSVKIAGKLEYMACTEEICDPIAEGLVAVSFDVEAGAARAEYATATPAPTMDNELEDASFWQFILLAIGGALFALVMPCTYPMIPITVSFFTKQAEQRGGKVLPLALTYGVGIVLIFAAIGAFFGEWIGPFAFHWITNLVITVAFFAFALALFGLINLQPPQFLMNVAGKASMKGGYFGVFLMGATLVVTSFTCTAPFVGSLIALGAKQGQGVIAFGMAVFGLTMAAPFVVLSLMPGKMQSLPRSGEWMNTLKVTLGFVELAAALKFLSNVDLALEWNWLSRELFLVIWSGIFAVTTAFLLGMIKLKGDSGEIGPGRLVGALLFVFLAAYSAYGALGNRMDGVIMAAMAPPYSNTISAAHGGGKKAPSWTVVIDDYDEARRVAIAENKKLFVNFTGHL